MKNSQVKFGRDFPFAVRKVPWDALWHLRYYARNADGKIYRTYDRVPQKEAVKASKKLVNQYNELPKELRGED